MDTQKPALTVGEAILGLGIAVLVGPHDTVAFVTLEGLLFAANRARRSDNLRHWATLQKEWLLELTTHKQKPLLPAPTASVVGESLNLEPAPITTTPAKGLSFTEFLSLVNDDPDEAPHLFVAGTSGSGKTVLAQTIAASRTGYVVVLDPKRPQGWKGAKWGGLPYVSRDNNGSLSPMVKALNTIVKEMNRRYKLQETATEPFPQITIIVDEGRNVVEEAPQMADLYKRIISIGREVGIRLVLISTTDRAGKLGFSGEADSLQSLTPVRLGNFAAPYLSNKEKTLYTGKPFRQAVIFVRGAWTAFDNNHQEVKLNQPVVWDGVEYNCQQPSCEEKQKTQSQPSAIGCVSYFSEEENTHLLAQLLLGTTSDEYLPSFLPSYKKRTVTEEVRGSEQSQGRKEVVEEAAEVSRVSQLAALVVECMQRERLTKSKAISRVTGANGGGYWQRISDAVEEQLKKEVA